MRSDEERVQELHARMGAMKRARARRPYRAACAASGAVCLAAAVLFAVCVSRLPLGTPGPYASATAASIFAGRSASRYIVVALVALGLGAAQTVFCLRMKKRVNKERHDVRKL